MVFLFRYMMTVLALPAALTHRIANAFPVAAQLSLFGRTNRGHDGW